MKIITLYIDNSSIMYGGAYRRYMELIQEFIIQNDCIYHISPRGFTNIFNDPFNNFYHLGFYKIPIGPSYFTFIIQALPISLYIGLKERIDVVLTFTLFDSIISIFFKLFNRGTKIILCDRGDPLAGMKLKMENNENSFKDSLLFAFLTLLEKFIYEKMDFVIFNTEKRREEMINKSNLKREKTTVIYNNANPSWVQERENGAYKESVEIRKKYNGTLICFIGNLFIVGRDILTVLKAFEIIKKEIQDSFLLIVGDGPDKNSIINIKEAMEFSNSIKILGWKDNPYSYMLAADVNVVAARHEGCSNTVLESLYFNKVVLGSNVGGIPEILINEDLLFSPGNEIELAKKILSALENNALDLKIQEIRKPFIFDWCREMIYMIKESFTKHEEK